MTDHTTAPATAQDENRLIAERRAKLAKLRETGVAYPNDFVPDARAAALHDKYDGQEQEALAANPVTVKVAGRMMLKRVMGKASFATLDSSGRIQIYLERGALGEDVRGLQAMGHRRHHRDRGVGLQDQQGRAVGACHHRAPAVQVAASAAGQVPRRGRPGTALPPALRRPHHDRRHAPHLRGAQQGHGQHPPVHAERRLPGSGNADAALIPAAPRPSPSSRITMRWTWKCSCASRPSCTSSA